eukprot:2383718-Prymnesium_polylepis.2
MRRVDATRKACDSDVSLCGARTAFMMGVYEHETAPRSGALSTPRMGHAGALRCGDAGFCEFDFEPAPIEEKSERDVVQLPVFAQMLAVAGYRTYGRYEDTRTEA